MADAWDIALQAQALSGHYRAAERSASGFVLDREDGPLRGEGYTAEARGGPFRITFDFRRETGQVAYRGHDQIGLPLSTRTRLAISDYGFLLGHAEGLQMLGGQWDLRVGAGARKIDRDILPSAFSGATVEVTKSTFADAEIDWRRRFDIRYRPTMSLFARYEDTLTQSLSVTNFGVTNPYLLSPGGGPVWMAGAHLEAHLAGGFSVSAGFDHTQMTLGSGGPVLVFRGAMPFAIATYPGSHQAIDSYALGLAWRLP